MFSTFSAFTHRSVVKPEDLKMPWCMHGGTAWEGVGKVKGVMISNGCDSLEGKVGLDSNGPKTYRIEGFLICHDVMTARASKAVQASIEIFEDQEFGIDIWDSQLI